MEAGEFRDEYRTNEYKYLGKTVSQNRFGKAKTDTFFKCNQWLE